MDRVWSALIVDDDPDVRQSIRLCLEASNARALGVGTRSAALEALERSRFDVVFLDLWLHKESGLSLVPELLRRQPGIGIIVITAYATFESAVEAIKLGASDYLPKPFTPDQIRHAAQRVLEARQLAREVRELREQISEHEAEVSFESKNTRYLAFLETARRAASSDSVLLLRGESGTGKNVLARWIRAHSKRAAAPFVTVLCPMLAGDLMTSELFGYKKGAFTGAQADSVGKVADAEGGTLFLDEIGDLTPDAQARLLRFLNDKTYERLGDTKERQADVRIVGATNRPLEEHVKAGRFREDLLFRLKVITLTLPPLRERPEDVLALARHYLGFFATQQGRQGLAFSEHAEHAIAHHPWPGNLRELNNAVERAVILAPADVIEPADLGLEDVRCGSPRRVAPVDLGGDCSIEDLEREHIARIIARAPSLEAAARQLGIGITTLHRKRKLYGLV